MKNQLCVLLGVVCFHFSAYSFSECNCSWEVDLVCIQMDDGNIVPFPNECWAKCMGFEEADFIDCDYDASFDPTCGCDFEIEPVCVASTTGSVLLYPNSCLAECKGYDSDDFLNCNYNLPTNPGCGCDYSIDEVCVEVEEDIFMPFPNTCWAICLGYTQDAFVDCDEVIDANQIQVHQTLEFYYDIILGDSTGLTGELPNSRNQLLKDPGAKVISDLKVYPNPINGNELSVKINIEVAAKMRIDLVSATGKLYKSVNHTGGGGLEVLMLDVSDLPGGMYYLSLYSGVHTKSTKFVKQ